MRIRSASTLATRHREPRGGYVIFAVLIVVVVLSLVAYRFADSMTSEYRAAVRANDDAQAKAAAISGLHYAAAILSDRETFYSDLGGNPYDNPDIFEQFEVAAAEGATTRKTYFSIRCVTLNDSGSPEQRFGVIDEGGKLNINSMIMLDPTGQKLHDALMKLPQMTEEIADAIVDWVDADDEPRASGVESSYYQGLANPYNAKNGPLNSLDELLLVKGIAEDPKLLYGGDKNRNGVQDEGEDDATRGWSDYLTIYGRELNVDMSGVKRININGKLNDTTVTDAITQDLAPAIGDEMAMFIIAYRAYLSTNAKQIVQLDASGNPPPSQPSGKDQKPRAIGFATPDQLAELVTKILSAPAPPQGIELRSFTELFNVGIKVTGVQGIPENTDLYAVSPLSKPEMRNQIFPLLLDKATLRKDIEMVPRINVNTAPREVLAAIAGMTDRQGQPLLDDAEIDAIIEQRANQSPTDPATVTGAWLVTAGTLQPNRYRRIERYLNGSTMVYRVQVIGYTDRGGPVARMEAVIDTNQGAPRFLHIRDLSDLENPRGFPPSTQTSK